MAKQEIEIPLRVVEETTKEFLDSLSFFRKGHKISLMNIRMDKGFGTLKKGNRVK